MSVSPLKAAYIGRQPIFNTDLDVYAYELLYRDGEKNVAGVFDGNTATTTVILNAFMEIGFENIVGQSRAFINLTRSFLDGSIPLPFSKKEVVLEILEDIEPDDELISQISELRAKGYRIALDDFIFDRQQAGFLPVSDIVKVDIQQVDLKRLAPKVAQLKESGLKTLAEKVETIDEFEACKEMGFDFYQGYFLSRPQVIEGKKLASSKLVLLELLSRLQDPDVGFGELESLVKRDAALSYKLLRYINSPAVGLSTEVESIQRALLLLGLETLKHWMTLLVIASVSEKPDELIHMALIRGKMCELLASKAGSEKVNSYFVVGLFSILDAMLDLPMPNILSELPLPQRLNRALVKHEEDEGDALACVLDYEESRWDSLSFKQLGREDISNCYLEAISWADSMMKGLKTVR